MHDLIFERGAPESEAELAGYAAQLGLEQAPFARDLHGPTVAERVRADEVGGLRSGVVGTPSLVLKSRHFRDKPDCATLSQGICTALLVSAQRR